MTLMELLESGLIKDDHDVCIRMQLCGTRRTIARGNWFQDQVLEYLDWKIVSFSFEHGHIWTICVETEV